MTKSTMSMLPPAPDKCQICAVKHGGDEPHNAQSFFYQYWFSSTYGRPVTWADAMMHCSDPVKEAWTANLKKCRIDINSPNLTGGIESQEEVADRLAE